MWNNEENGEFENYSVNNNPEQAQQPNEFPIHDPMAEEQNYFHFQRDHDYLNQFNQNPLPDRQPGTENVPIQGQEHLLQQENENMNDEDPGQVTTQSLNKVWSVVEKTVFMKFLNKTAEEAVPRTLKQICEAYFLKCKKKRPVEQIFQNAVDWMNNTSRSNGEWSMNTRIAQLFNMKVPITGKTAEWLRTNGDVRFDDDNCIATFKSFTMNSVRYGKLNKKNTTDELHGDMLYFLKYLSKTALNPIAPNEILWKFNKVKDGTMNYDNLIQVLTAVKIKIETCDFARTEKARMALITQTPVPSSMATALRATLVLQCKPAPYGYNKHIILSAQPKSGAIVNQRQVDNEYKEIEPGIQVHQDSVFPTLETKPMPNIFNGNQLEFGDDQIADVSNSEPDPGFVNSKELLKILEKELNMTFRNESRWTPSNYQSRSLLPELQVVISDAMKNGINVKIPMHQIKLAFENAIRVIVAESQTESDEVFPGDVDSISVIRLMSFFIDFVLRLDSDSLSEIFEKFSTERRELQYKLFRLPKCQVEKILMEFVNPCL